MVSRGANRLGRKRSVAWQIVPAILILSWISSAPWRQTSIIMGTYTDMNNILSSPPLLERKHPCKSIQASMILFGVPKMFKYIFKSYVRNIIEQNPHVDFSVHLHMYHDLLMVNTPRNGEQGIPAETPERVLAMTRSLMEDSSSINFITSNQTAFDQTLSSWLGQSDRLYDYDMITTMNIFRQGNSMKNAFLLALGSRLEGTRILSENVPRCGNSTVYLFLRSDTLLISPITIPQTGLQSNNIILPTWEAWRGAAYNDRLAVAGPYAAEIYAEAKASGFKDMILNQKSKNSSLYDLGTPERMLKSYFDKKADQLNVTLVDHWAKLLRIRTDGTINDRDKGEFGIQLNNVNNLTFAWTPV